MGNSSEIIIKRTHTLTDILLSTAVFAAGVGTYFVLPGWGILFCFVGVLLFAFRKSGIIRTGDGTRLREKSLDLPVSCRDSILSFLEGGTTLPDLVPCEDNEHLYLEVYYNAEAKVAYAKLYDVAPCSFEQATPYIEVRGERAELLIGKL